MRTSGRFTTTTSPARLRALASEPAVLESVSTLSGVRAWGPGTVRTVFSPVTALGPISLDTTITVVEERDDGVRLRVRGRRGAQSADVDLVVDFAHSEPGDDGPSGWTVTWTAELVVRGSAASVGQRVAGDIATRAIGQVLAEAAGAAGGQR